MQHLPGYLVATAVAVLLSSVPLRANAPDAAACVQIAQADVVVHGYRRSNGTSVPTHMRTAPDGNPYNNYSYPGNLNPYTGKVAPGNPATYLRNSADHGGTPYHTWTGYQTK